MTMNQADQLKAEGNKAFSGGDFDAAEKLFSQAIEVDPTNHVLYSNRSACYCSLKDYKKALDDANKTVELKKDWVKGYSRKGAALFGAGRYEEAADAYSEGLLIEPENALLKKGLEETEAQLGGGGGASGLGQFFGPDMLQKIAANPKVAKYLAQPDYVQKIQQIQQNPNNVNAYMADPRIMETIISLMNLNMPTMPTGQDDSMEDVRPTPTPSQPEAVKKEQPKEEPMPAAEESEEEKQKAEALHLKEEGNKHYKKREFDQALNFYAQAWEKDSTNVSILNNKAAVLFEMEKYDECIETCEKAVEIGRENRADYKLIARALGRIGTAYHKQNKLDEAIKYFEKSLTEHRTADVLNKLRECEKLREQRAKEAYYNPELSDKAREEGNAYFKKNDYASAVPHYTEAIKRNDKDPRAYSNRAACYQKLMALPEALKDCEKCIELDPAFIKAYIRKASILFTKRDYADCVETLALAREQDKEGKHTHEIQELDMKAQLALRGFGGAQEGETQEETLRKARDDPEIQSILADPIMNQILQQMQQDPKAIQDHMKNPQVAAKMRKLMQAGIVRVG